MGVLNVTPDSFSDGGAYFDADAAIRHGFDLVAQGADIIDVGGESTRPGATPVDPAEEQRRVLPVIAALAEAGITISIDTMSAATARAAIEAGASIINDVSGGLADPEILTVAAQAGVRYIAMHWRGGSRVMDSLAVYDDTVAEVVAELGDRVAAAQAAGIPRHLLVIDPGLGFAKGAADNWHLLAGFDHLEALGLPVMVGASRKRFLADVVAEGAEIVARDVPTAVLSALLAQRNVWAVRVHDVAATRSALDVVGMLGAARRDEDDVAAHRDRLRLIGLTATGHHGVYDFERRDGQRFVVDLELWLDLQKAAGSDDINDTVHYGELAAEVVARIESEPVDLIETLAEELATLVLAREAVRAVTVTVHKPQAPIEAPFDDVSVTIHRRRPLTSAVVALGSNLGDRAATLRLATSLLADHTDVWVTGLSSFVESPAMKLDGVDLVAPAYLNAVATVRTRLTAHGLLKALAGIEDELGRVRSELWGDRTIDLDLITYADAEQRDEVLTLPHPRAAERAFVLVPWLELDPEAVLPGRGPIATLVSATTDEIWPWTPPGQAGRA